VRSMAKRNLVEQLDEAVAAIIAGGASDNADLDAGRSGAVDQRLAPLVRIAAELRHLPRQDYKSHLKSRLLGDAAGSIDIAPAIDIAQAVDLEREMRSLRDAGGRPVLRGNDAGAVLASLPDMSVRLLASMNQCAVGVSRFSSRAHRWERHPDGDELLHVLEGELDVTTLTESGPVRTNVPAGSVFVTPRGLWHWPRPVSPVSLLFVTPWKGSEHSNEEDPRPRRGRPSTKQAAAKVGTGTAPAAHDLRGVLRGLKPLAISSSTTEEQADAAFSGLGSLNQCGLYLGSFSGMSPWECHDAGDELLHVLDGEVDITVLTEGGPFRTTSRSGSVFVCPRGLWHRQYSANGATVLSATPQPTRISFAADPR
jgi:quercetin dioxygenase-like cupin family protein